MKPIFLLLSALLISPHVIGNTLSTLEPVIIEHLNLAQIKLECSDLISPYSFPKKEEQQIILNCMIDLIDLTLPTLPHSKEGEYSLTASISLG